MSTTNTNTPERGNQVFLFGKDNYMWMIIGVVLILLGMFLLSGGKSADPHVYDTKELFSIRRVTIAPIVILLGFAVEVYAILKKPAAEKE